MWISKSVFEKMIADKDNEIQYLRDQLSRYNGVRSIPKKSLGVADLKEEAIAYAINLPAETPEDAKLKEEALSQINKLLG